MEPFELTIVMPCLNEAETLARCIEKAKRGLESAGVTGEVLIADNGSTDGSLKIAADLGARVVNVAAKGYGSALRGGIEAAKAPWIIMGDADDSYDFSNITPFVEKLRAGNELVMGCRLPSGGGTIAPGAMPWKNRWLGNPSLSFLGRLFFRTPIHDFHCGMRGFTKAAYEKMQLVTTGMEFASEMIVKASLGGLKVDEAPITLYKDGRSRPPHLRPWRDGWRHLRFMLIYSPRWLFLIPGLLLATVGALAAAVILFSPIQVERWHIALSELVAAGAAMIIGAQLVAFAFFSKVFGVAEGLMPSDQTFTNVFRSFSLERGLIGGVALLIGSLGLGISSLSGFAEGVPHPQSLLRIVAAGTLVVLSVQVISSSFFMSVLGLKTASRKPPEPPES